MIASVLIWLDNTVLSIALETLADPVKGLNASPGELQWATGAYTLVFATLMFTAGALGDRFGHRLMIMFGLAAFACASLWAAYAGTAGQLIAARALMGLGAAFIMPANFAILLWTFTGPKRATAIAISSTNAGIGMAVGPVVAGVLISHFWWGSIFIINIPIVAVALLGTAFLVPNFRSPIKRSLDPAGMLLSVSGLATLSYGLIRAGQVTSWGAIDVWLPILIGVTLLGVFILTELNIETPSFDPRLLAQRTFGGANAAMALLFFSVAAITFYNAFYMQGVLYFSPLKAGLANLPTALGAIIGAPLGARLVSKWSLRPVAVPSLLVAALTMAGYGFLNQTTPLVWIEALLLVQGLTVGMVMGPVTGALLSTLPLEKSGAGSAITNTVRQAGSVIGIAVGGTIMSIAYRSEIKPSLVGVPRDLADRAEISAEQARHVAGTYGITGLQRAADAAFVHAMHFGVIWIAAATFAGAILLVFALRPATQTPAPTEAFEAPGPVDFDDRAAPTVRHCQAVDVSFHSDSG
ncbi:MFS transporter [Rhodococcus sp. 1163]|uniref:MFS transporter n=1 Tax=Rhodococcus sp. 1163 TaxID=1905289 RepID=UPI0009FBEC81|nr:MFS transporter [Rhodococcus sp. 1163]